MTDLDLIATVVGTDVAAISIIIVYHLYALQSWTERGHDMLDGAIQLSLSTGPGSLQREDLGNRAQTWFRQFPWWLVGVLGLAVIGMCALGVIAASSVTSRTSWVLVAGPLVVLALVYSLSTGLIWRQGQSVLKQTLQYLGIARE